jgi:acylphosphatase
VIRVAFVVRGRVQGVGYRWFAQQSAASLGIAGFVRNERDGRVAGEAEGEEDTVAAFVAALRCGPLHARVDEVATSALPPTGGRGFTVAR